MVIFHEKFESNPDFICNYIKMKKEEEITRKLSISKLDIQNISNELEAQMKNEVIEKIESSSEVKVTKSKKITKRSNSKIRTKNEEVPKTKRKHQNTHQQRRRVPVNTPISSNLATISRHGRIISVKKFNIK